MRREDGSMSVVAAALVGVACLVGLGVATIAGVAGDRATARAGADLAALAAAHAVRSRLDGEGSAACDVAREVAQDNLAVLEACEVFRDGSVQVRVSVGGAMAEARAGPEVNPQEPGGGAG